LRRDKKAGRRSTQGADLDSQTLLELDLLARPSLAAVHVVEPATGSLWISLRPRLFDAAARRLPRAVQTACGTVTVGCPNWELLGWMVVSSFCGKKHGILRHFKGLNPLQRSKTTVGAVGV